MPGPPPKPTAIKKLQGNPGRRKLNDKEPQSSRKIPPPPKWLDKVAKQNWKRESEELKSMGVLTKIDWGIFAARCYLYSQIVKLSEDIEVEGRTIDTKQGPKSNPKAVQLDKIIKEYRMIGSSLGADPASRSKIQVAEPKKKKTKAQLLKEKSRLRRVK